MGKISPYRQGQLESSQVGVSQADNSGLSLAQDLQQGVAGVARTELEGSNVNRRVTDQNIQLQHAEQLRAFQGIGSEIQQRIAEHNYELRKAQADHLARIAEQQKLQDSSNTASHIAKASMALDDIYTATQQELKGNAAKMPEEFATRANGYLKLYASQNGMNDKVATGFQNAMNEKLTSYHKSANDYMVSQGNAEAKANFDGALDIATQQAGLSKGAYQQAMASIYGPDMQKNAFLHYGAGGTEALRKAAVTASKNFLEASIYSAEARPDHIDQNIALTGNLLTEQEKEMYRGRAQSVIQGQEAQAQKDTVLQGHAETLRIAATIDAVKQDPSAPTYRQDLDKVRHVVASTLEEEHKKPIREPGSPTFGPDKKPIQYQSPQVVSYLEAKRNFLDGQMVSFDNAAKAELRASQAQTKAEAKEIMQAHKERVQEALDNAHIEFNQGQGLRDNLDRAMGQLRAYTIPNIGGKQMKTTADQVEAYNAAVLAYHTAETKGAIDEPGRTASRPSSTILKELNAIGAKLRPQVQRNGGDAHEADTMIQAMGWLNHSAPPALHQILNDYGGKISDRTNVDFVHDMLDTYDLYKARLKAKGMPDREPDVKTIQLWRDKVSLSHAAKAGEK